MESILWEKKHGPHRAGLLISDLIMADKRMTTKRDSHYKIIINMVEKGRTLMAKAELSKSEENELKVLIKNIKIKKEYIDKLNEMIVDAIDEQEIEKEIEKSSEVDLLVDTELHLMDELLSKLVIDDSASPTVCGKRESATNIFNSVADINLSGSFRSSDNANDDHDDVRRKYNVKLPPLIVKRFSGDPVTWPQFMDTFRSAIHENKHLSDIERFTYLKSYVEGDTERCLEGLGLTAENYEHGLKILEERFGNTQLVVSKHMST